MSDDELLDLGRQDIILLADRRGAAETLLRDLWALDSEWPAETPDALLDQWRAIAVQS